MNAFFDSGLERVVFPRSLRRLSQGAFAKCGRLKEVRFGEGLIVLGTDEYPKDGWYWCGVFQASALESVALPPTLKRIGERIFRQCKNLKNIPLPDGLETIGIKSFSESGLEEVTLPVSVRDVAASAFYGC